ncbi:hypothetical protein B5P45_00275 [Phyllobacterium zundukense]|uniref:Uncharacterized protein n=1 Tax=Phyllobacterium zundukense TaxID=1867719 RepID=A0A2N9W3G5_9HYPH|nr:hypothetical protein BLM14_11780 [Phyllobacterium zundukense]PIO46283.1 hypothetical protein B5P45_00275 [Phyllobacterium zundukense]
MKITVVGATGRMAREFRSASPYVRFGLIDSYALAICSLYHSVIPTPLPTEVMKYSQKRYVTGG